MAWAKLHRIVWRYLYNLGGVNTFWSRTVISKYKSDSPPLCILLATHNGEKYLREQIESIQAQSYSNWILLARDDGSTDGCRELLGALASEDSRITVLEGVRGDAVGAVCNFGTLMLAGLATAANVFFFCDQDDYWLTHKLCQQFQVFPEQGLESMPLLVHSDLEVVDQELGRVHSSLIEYMALDATPAQPLNYLVSRNFVTGCAMAVNRKLLEAALPLGKGAIMHDWWIALIASAQGRIEFVPQTLIKYRQHDSNVLGAKSFWHGVIPGRTFLRQWRRGNREFQETFQQVDSALAHPGGKASWSLENQHTLERYASLPRLSLLSRLKMAGRLGIRQENWVLRTAFYLRLLSVRVPRSET